MSAQAFADNLENRDLPGLDSLPETSTAKGKTRSGGRGKGKKNETIIEGENGGGKGNEGNEGEGDNSGRDSRGAEGNGVKEGDIDQFISNKRNGDGEISGVNRNEDAVGDNMAPGVLTGLGRSAETMKESPYIELAHKKWDHNIKSAFLKSNKMQYNSLRSAYEVWCEEEQTRPRQIQLFELDVDEVMAVTDQVEKSGVDKEEPKKKKETVNTKMEIGDQLKNNMTALSNYWHEIMINKNIHVPVSIFCPKWLLQDANFMRTRRSKVSCTSDVIPYIGSPYLNEFRLSFAEWSIRYNLMVKYHESKYDKLEGQKDYPIAPRLMAHRDNVLQIQIDCYGKWPPAMRYDIAHRRNIWENRLENGAMADVGTLNKSLAEQAEKDSKHYGDYNYKDNPYVFGGPMQHYNPMDGAI